MRPYGGMATRGTIVRNNSGENPWSSSYADGKFAGNFKSAREAQNQIEVSVNRRLRWVPETRGAGVEAFRGEDPT